MSGSLNRVELIGHLGRDPEIRNTQNGKRVASMSLAVSETWKDKSGQKQEKTEWVPIVIFNDGLVGVVEKYVKKGDKLYIEGAFKTRKYTDKSGNERYTTEVVLSAYSGTLIMLGSPNGGGKGRQDDYIPEHTPATRPRPGPVRHWRCPWGQRRGLR